MKKNNFIFYDTFSFGTASTVSAQEFDVAANMLLLSRLQLEKSSMKKDANQPVEIASITKLVTVYLVYEALEQGTISLSTPVDISDYPYKLTTNSEA